MAQQYKTPLYLLVVLSLCQCAVSRWAGSSFQSMAACAPGQDYATHEDCTRYYDCTGPNEVLLRCPLGLYWNPDIAQCDFPSAVPECINGGRPPVTVPPSTSEAPPITTVPVPSTTAPVPITTDPVPITTVPVPITTGEPAVTVSTTTEDPTITCDLEFGYQPHHDCTKYYICSNYIGAPMRCPLGLFWNPDINQCDFPYEVPECTGEGATRPDVFYW